MQAEALLECGGLPPLRGAGLAPTPNSGSKLPHSIDGSGERKGPQAIIRRGQWLDVALEQARDDADGGGQARRHDDGRSRQAGDFISAAEIRQFRDWLEARLAGSDPGTITLHSIDVLGEWVPGRDAGAARLPEMMPLSALSRAI